MSDAFAPKLDLVLKALSLSRVELAAELGVDKSAVGRWVTGAAVPTGYNLARLTALAAAAALALAAGGVQAAVATTRQFPATGAPPNGGCARACAPGSTASDPVAWVLMILGFGTLGAVFRSGRRPVSV